MKVNMISIRSSTFNANTDATLALPPLQKSKKYPFKKYEETVEIWGEGMWWYRMYLNCPTKLESTNLVNFWLVWFGW